MIKSKFIAVHPVLPVRNVTNAIAYYTVKLGFECSFKDEESDPKYAGIKRDGVELHLQSHDEIDFGSVEKLSLRFYIEGVDELFEEFSNKNVFHENTALRDTPWGTRELPFMIQTVMV